MRRKLVVGAAVVVAGVGATGVAWAALSGVLITPDIAEGLINGGGSSSCQNSGVTFTVPSPTWNNVEGDYMISTIAYAGIASQCVTLGTADLILNITAGGPNSIASATASNMSTASGTLTLSTPITFDDATTGSYRYLVKDQ